MRNETPPSSKDDLFTDLRPSLYAIAYHMLGNSVDAEDMLQEAFLRWRSSESQVRAPKAFLTTVVTHLCLKHLKSRRVRREEPLGLEAGQATSSDAHAPLADALTEALLVVLKALSPLERAVYLLREVFDCEYSDIAGTVERSEEHCRQILLRARKRVASRRNRYEVLPEEERRIVEHFVRAASGRDRAGLITALADDATLVCDGSDVGRGSVFHQGMREVAGIVLERVSSWLQDGVVIQLFRFQGRPGMLASRNGLPVGSLLLSTREGAIGSVRVITCPVRLRTLLIVC